MIWLLKFTFIASIKVIPYKAFSARHNPSKENKKIQKELNKNAKKTFFCFIFITNKTSIHHHRIVYWITPNLQQGY